MTITAKYDSIKSGINNNLGPVNGRVDLQLNQHAELPVNQIVHGNCIEVLGNLPAKSVDLIFADPPYNLQLKERIHRPDMSLVGSVADKWDKFDSTAEYDAFTLEWLSACRRVLKDNGGIWVIGSYHNIYRVGKILMDLGFWILNDVIWVKSNPMPNFRGVRLTNAHEILIWAQKKKGAPYTFNYQVMKAFNNGVQLRSVWEIPVCGGKERIKIDGAKAHSTQKPEALLYRAVLTSSKPGDIILDPFFGTGTTGAVAKRLHRNWIGIEQDEQYIEIAHKRIVDLTVPLASDDLFELTPKPAPFKVPFGRLLEIGLIRPGDKIFLDKTGDEATVLPDGTIQSGEYHGSIHAVGRAILGTPCNGWIHWDYIDAENNKSSINTLREEVRRQATSDAPEHIEEHE